MDIKDLLSSKEWLIVEKSFDPSLQNVRETQYTLGNGYLGMRGIYEEIPYDSLVGTYIAGVYDAYMSQVTELVNAPNPIDFKIMSDGEKLDIKAMKIKRHYRALDMRRGTIARKTVFLDRHNHAIEYQSLRFMSRAAPHLGVMRIEIKSLDTAKNLIVQTNVDTSVTNRGLLNEGRKSHFKLTTVDTKNSTKYTEVETYSSKIRIGYAMRLSLSRPGKEEEICHDLTFPLEIEKGKSLCFTLLFSIYTSNDVQASRVRSSAVKEIDEASQQRFSGCFERHCRSWDELWRRSDVIIKGDDEVQKALRFNIYHLLICGNEHNEKVSIGARTLSGDGYRGHVFWDSEIYMFPFFLYTWPQVATNLLRYRFHQLDQARANAEDAGYDGALFGWETADSGEDVTPTWFKGLDHSVVKVETSLEHHLMSDIAYAINHYHQASGDDHCMASWGAEILFETARFWASRVTKRNGRALFDIKDIIGPDEFHVHVDNNAFTNFMVRWNLEAAHSLYYEISNKKPARFKKLTARIGLKKKEVDSWLEIAQGIVIPTNKKGTLIEEFDGFFKRKRVKLDKLDENFMPEVRDDLPVTDLTKTQLIKQGDVLLLFNLFPDEFAPHIMRENFRYYERRTTHKSSLSHGVHSLAALLAQYPVRAYHYFHYCVLADMQNHHKNTADGIHGGSLGATWQAAVCGFGGLRISNNLPWLKPHLPLHWKSLSYKVHWHGNLLNVHVTQEKVRVSLEMSSGKGALTIGIYDNIYELNETSSLTVTRDRERVTR